MFKNEEKGEAAEKKKEQKEEDEKENEECRVTLCGSCKNRRFGGTYRILHHGEKSL
jgi:hypothetical protein